MHRVGTEEGHMRTLVVYYSRSGSTAIIAGALAAAVGATMRELVDRSSHVGPMGLVLAALTGRSAKLVDADFDVSAYDTVVLLTPVWAGRPAPAANTFLRTANLMGKKMLIVAVGASVENPRAVTCLEKMALAAGAVLVGVRQVRGASASEKIAPCPTPEELADVGESLGELLDQTQNQQE